MVRNESNGSFDRLSKTDGFCFLGRKNPGTSPRHPVSFSSQRTISVSFWSSYVRDISRETPASLFIRLGSSLSAYLLILSNKFLKPTIVMPWKLGGSTCIRIANQSST